VINTVLHHLGKTDSNGVSTFTELSNIERVCYLRFFLETEGAVLLKLAERFCETGGMSYQYLKENIQDMIEGIYEEYIDIAPDFRVRSRIKKLLDEMKRQMRSKERYDDSTVGHKIKPNLQALADVGILSVDRTNVEYKFSPVSVGTTSSLSIIYDRLKTMQNMENMFLNNEYFPLIAELYSLTPSPYGENYRDLLIETISYGYKSMRNKITRMADIDAIVEWCCIKMLSEHNVLVQRQDLDGLFNRIRKERPSSIQYHLDGRGRIAYMIFTEPL